MKTFWATFQGHYPVGACAIIVAVDELQANLDLRDQLEREGLDRHQDLTLIELDTSEAQVVIPLNGDY